MTETAARTPITIPDPPLDTTSTEPWIRVLAWTVAITVAADAVFMLLVGELIPPVAFAGVVTIAALLLLRARPRAGIVVVGAISLLWSLGSTQFSLPHLAHPDSGIDFVHATISLVGGLLAAGAAVAAWRRSSATSARRFAVTALVGLAAVTATGTVATLATSGDTARAGDEVATVEATSFPADVTVPSGATLFVDNRDVFRHTFTVEGTTVDAELPARQGVRIPVDLPAGTYEVICSVPGHDAMTGRLTVS